MSTSNIPDQMFTSFLCSAFTHSTCFCYCSFSRKSYFNLLNELPLSFIFYLYVGVFETLNENIYIIYNIFQHVSVDEEEFCKVIFWMSEWDYFFQFWIFVVFSEWVKFFLKFFQLGFYFKFHTICSK